MEHSTTQALVMEPPYIPFVKNSGKHYKKQENIRAYLVFSTMI